MSDFSHLKKYIKYPIQIGQISKYETGVEQSSNAQNKDLNKNNKIHVKDSLKHGELYLHHNESVSINNAILYFDNSLSVQKIIPIEKINSMISFIISWFSFHQIKTQVYNSSKHNKEWNENLWSYWDTKILPNSLTIVFSDFHGNIPKGSFWKNLYARTTPILIKLNHSLPASAFYSCYDIESPKNELNSNINIMHLINHFKNSLDMFFKTYPVNPNVIDSDHSENCIKTLINILTTLKL